MPTDIWGVGWYVFALFPGVAFIFAREGHQPAIKRSALRETAAVVFISATCAAVLAIPVAIMAACWKEFRDTLVGLLRGDSSWIRDNLPLAIAISIIFLGLITGLGFFLGSRWAHEHGLKRLWQSDIPRDTSAWSVLFTAAREDQAVDVAVTLKSGAWISGVLYAFDNDPDPHPGRTITLTHPSMRSAGADDAIELEGTDYVLIEAGDIELLQASYRQVDANVSPPG